MEHKVFTASPSSQTKSFLVADDELAQLERQLARAVSEVGRLKAVVAKKRASVGSLFAVARDADGGTRHG